MPARQMMVRICSIARRASRLVTWRRSALRSEAILRSKSRAKPSCRAMALSGLMLFSASER